MKRTISVLLAAMLLAVLTGCPQSAPEASGQNGPGASPLPEENTELTAPPEEPSPAAPEQLFDALELDIDKGTMYIRAGDAFSYTRHGGSDADYEITDGTLYISQHLDGETVLTLPEDMVYTSLQLTVGEGHVYAESVLSLGTLELNVKRGEVTLSALSVADGSVIEVGQGAAFLFGDPGKSVAASSREGQLSMEVSCAQGDYNFEVELSMGHIHLGSEDYQGLSVSKSINNGAERFMELNCARGNLSVEFDGR